MDAAVRGFWVDTIFCRHKHVDEEQALAALLESEFAAFIPQLEWPLETWTVERVRRVLDMMRGNVSPGSMGIPIAVWRVLPDVWMRSVARFFTLLESGGRWPEQWLSSYVTMIPKGAGGGRPQDQRPITVLEVAYRVWVKGLTLEWGPALHREYLGSAAMGFRRGCAVVGLPQVLLDVLRRREEEGRHLWLASFDVEKCYDTVPWWAMFGIMRRSGMRGTTVDSLEDFHRRLRRRFRYGQVDGREWGATNGLMQGCPGSPDELNMLMEPFHQWARAKGYGVEVAGHRIPSLSFADDIVLLGGSKNELEILIAGYMRWMALLLLRVTVAKTQVWWSGKGTRKVKVGGERIETGPTFKVVGVILGSNPMVSANEHVAKRVRKAEETAQRLRCLQLPAGICGLLWRSVVLPQALYGCEVVDYRPSHLRRLVAQGKAIVSMKSPLWLNKWRAPEVLMGWPLGEMRAVDPIYIMRLRQVTWLIEVANAVGLVGVVNRAVSTGPDGTWVVPEHGVQKSLLAWLGWRVKRNQACRRSSRWPELVPEGSYEGDVCCVPDDALLLTEVVFTDGSVCAQGGAAAVRPDGSEISVARVVASRSNTHCELVAFSLAMRLRATQVVTDSLVALHLLRTWGCRTIKEVLRCGERDVVRHILHLAASGGWPRLQKVKAHDTEALALGRPQAVGNDLADSWAKRAATEEGVPLWDGPGEAYADPVELMTASGERVLDIQASVEAVWWSKARSARRARPRRWLELLNPETVAVSVPASVGIFEDRWC